MLPATEQEKAGVIGYYLSQSPGAEVTFLQKVYSEAIIGHRHDIWDVHATDGRWWVITNPTNLYSQTQFPNMDLAVTFHMGLCLRVPRTQQHRESDRNIDRLGSSSPSCARRPMHWGRLRMSLTIKRSACGAGKHFSLLLGRPKTLPHGPPKRCPSALTSVLGAN